MDQARELAEQFLSGHGKEAGAAAPAAGGPAPPGAAPAKAGAGDAEGHGGGLMGLATSAARNYFGQGEGGGAVGASQGGQADPGVVDTLLSLYQSTTGQQFGGQEHEYDRLSGLAHSVLGTQVGRDVLKSWVKQRAGL